MATLKLLSQPARLLLLPFVSLLPVVTQGAPVAPVFNLDEINGTTGFSYVGAAANDFAGAANAARGDVNGDGIADLIVGAHGADPGGVSRAGRTYVVFGGNGVGGSGALTLSALGVTDGFSMQGSELNQFLGWSVANTGDLNNDGVDEILIGAPDTSPNGSVVAGKIYIVFGGSALGGSGSFTLDSGNSLVLEGLNTPDRIGQSVASGGDLNGDGIHDLVIGARGAGPNGQPDAGVSYVLFGNANLTSSSSINLANLQGSNGFVLTGEEAGDGAGHAVEFVGDINSDGIDDLLVGAPGVDAGGEIDTGAGYVIFGATNVGGSGELSLSNLVGSNGFMISGMSPLDRAGQAVSAGGDINDDGIDDLIISADHADPGGRDLAGESYVIFGSTDLGTGGEFDLTSLNGSNGYVVEGVAEDDIAGNSLSGASDVNGDGVADFLIGAPGAGTSIREHHGETYVIFGGSSVGSTGTLALSSLDGASGFVISGVSATDFSGRSVTMAGDLNNDGVSDVVIGADSADSNASLRAGVTNVVFMPLPDLAEPNNNPGQATAIISGQTLSNSIAPVGDVDRFEFTLTQAASITLQTARDGTAVSYDTFIELFNSAGVLLGSDDNGGAGRWSKLTLNVPAGTYQASVSSSISSKVIPSYTVTLNVDGSSDVTPQAEINLVSSCLAGNGRIDLNIVNTETVNSLYTLQLNNFFRQRSVLFENWGRFSITGRPPGIYSATVERDGQEILSETVTVNCAATSPPVSSPEVAVVNSCLETNGLTNGLVLFQMVNPTNNSRPYVIEFEGVANRSTTAAAYGQAVRGTSGRPDGVYSYRVRTGSTVIEEGALEVDCD